MSRRKDRERFISLKGRDPEYTGFRGYHQANVRPQAPPLRAVTCSICGRRRNVPAEVAQEQSTAYVCLSCQEEQGTEPQEAPAA